MPISFSCPQCGKNFNADDSFAGKKVRCKQCGTKTTVPSPSSGSQKPGSRPPEPDDLYGLAEPAPMLPPRAPLPRNNISENTPTRKTKGTASKSSTGVKKGAPWAAIAIGVLILRVFLRLNRGNQGHPDNPVIQPQAAASIVATAPSGPPPFPQRGPGTLIRPGVRVFEARASGPSNVATMNMTVWAYLPDGAHDRRSLPCVIVAPAGSIIISGMELGDGDRAEHFPYEAAGYAVLAYSLDGYVENLQELTDPRLGPTCAVCCRAGRSVQRPCRDRLDVEEFPRTRPRPSLYGWPQLGGYDGPPAGPTRHEDQGVCGARPALRYRGQFQPRCPSRHPACDPSGRSHIHDFQSFEARHGDEVPCPPFPGAG